MAWHTSPRRPWLIVEIIRPVEAQHSPIFQALECEALVQIAVIAGRMASKKLLPRWQYSLRCYKLGSEPAPPHTRGECRGRGGKSKTQTLSVAMARMRDINDARRARAIK